MDDNELIKKTFIDFVTQPQTYELGKATFKDFTNYLCEKVNELEGYFASYDTLTDEINIISENCDINTVIIAFLDNQKFEIKRNNIDLSYEDKRTLGNCIMAFMSAYAAWETEFLPMNMEDEGDSLQIYLSLTKVKLTEEEKETIEGILKRMALERNLYYNQIERTSFEIELRGRYPKDAPTVPTLDDIDDLEWI